MQNSSSRINSKIFLPWVINKVKPYLDGLNTGLMFQAAIENNSRLVFYVVHPENISNRYPTIIFDVKNENPLIIHLSRSLGGRITLVAERDITKFGNNYVLLIDDLLREVQTLFSKLKTWIPFTLIEDDEKLKEDQRMQAFQSHPMQQPINPPFSDPGFLDDMHTFKDKFQSIDENLKYLTHKYAVFQEHRENILNTLDALKNDLVSSNHPTIEV